MIALSLYGQRFGKLIVIKRMGQDKYKHFKWLCLCDCGKKTTVVGYDLKRNQTQSCGCLKLECSVTHGHTSGRRTSPTYGSWFGMIQRCTNPNNKEYHNYGKLGIEICKKWRDSFENFLEDMGERPFDCTLERKDNKKGYYPGNCKWATRKEQARNKRSNRLITHNGKTQLLIEWAEKTGINRTTITSRIDRYGWSIKKALTTPVENSKNR